MTSVEKHYKNISDEREAVKLFKKDIEEATGEKVIASHEFKAEGCCRKERLKTASGDKYLIYVSWTRINKGNSRDYRCIAERYERKQEKEQMDLFEL